MKYSKAMNQPEMWWTAGFMCFYNVSKDWIGKLEEGSESTALLESEINWKQSVRKVYMGFLLYNVGSENMKNVCFKNNFE